MIGFADFVPAKIREGGFFNQDDFAPIQQAVDRANPWVADNDVQVFNVETVALPNMLARGEQGPQDAMRNVSDDFAHQVYQFVRPWRRYDA